MTIALRLTDAGRAAMLDAGNTGTQAVRITKLALGAGSGPGGDADDDRTTLRDQRDIQDVVGSAAVAGQIAVRAEFNTATSYPATEMGLFARIAAQAEFLFAYWTDAGEVFLNKPADLRTLVAATIAIRRSAAQLNVTIAPDLSVGTVGTFDDLSDTPASKVNAARRKVTVSADGRSLEYLEGLTPTERAEVQALIDGVLDGAPGALDTLNELAAALGDDPNFAATITAQITGLRDARHGIGGRRDGKATSYNATLADDGKIIEVDASGGARTVNLPDLAGANNGYTLTVIKADASANTVTADGHGADTINGMATAVLRSRWEGMILKWTGTAWIAIGGASSLFLRDFFGGASSREFTTAGAHRYTWEWETPNGLAILVGGAGGGGSGGGSNRSGGGLGSNGSAGSESSMVIEGVTHRARGGGPGGGAGNDRSITRTGDGLGADAGGGGAGGAGGTGAGRGAYDGGDGGNGSSGEVRVIALDGLSIGDVFAINLGAGGAPGVNDHSIYTPDQRGHNGVAGGPGKLILIPLY